MNVSVNGSYRGLSVSIQEELSLEALNGFLEVLQSILEPGVSASVTDNARRCPIHGTELSVSRKKQGMLYCPDKDLNSGRYCTYEEKA